LMDGTSIMALDACDFSVAPGRGSPSHLKKSPVVRNVRYRRRIGSHASSVRCGSSRFACKTALPDSTDIPFHSAGNSVAVPEWAE
jgi:hypothetical protein